MPKAKKQTFIQGIGTLLFSQIFAKILGLGYKLYLTNKEGFGDAGNGIYSSSFQIYTLFLTISSVGVPNTISKLVSEKYSIGDEKGAKKIFKVAFVLFSIIGFGSSIILFINANFIANKILEIPETEITLQIFAPSIFFISIISVFRGYFNAKENMWPTANSQLIEQLIKAVFTVVIVEYICVHINTNNKTELMVAGAGLAMALSSIICYLYLLKFYKKEQIIKKIKCNTNPERIRTIIKHILIVSAPITITVILGTINKNIDSLTVVRGLKNFMSSEQAKIEYGILSGKVETLIALPMSFNVALTTSLIPTIAAAKARKSVKEVKNKIRFSIVLTVLIGMPASVGMIVFAKQILNLLFPNASSGVFIYQISSISIIFVLLNQTITGILQGLGKQFAPIISLACGVIVKLITNLILVNINPSKYLLGGTAGAAMGTVLCYISTLIINIIILKKKLNIKLVDYKFIIKIITSIVLMILGSKGIFYLLNHIIGVKLSTIISIIIAILIYLISLFSMKILNINLKNRINFNKKENKIKS